MNRAALTDGELFEQWRSLRNCEAFAELDRRHRPGMFRYAAFLLARWRVADAEGCGDECVNDTFLRLSLRTKPLPHVRNWLYRVLHNRAVDRGRRHGRQPPPVSILAADEGKSSGVDPPDDGPDPLEELLLRETPERMELLLHCLDDLAEDSRLLLAMHYLQDHSYAAIASQTGLTENQIGMRLFRARQQLRECYLRRVAAFG